jgi:PAS domain S-box-containing protein
LSVLDALLREHPDALAHYLASIVESSDDAIIGTDLNGTIKSWNRGAGRLFAYTAEEAVAKPVTMLIPADRQDEEVRILGRIRRGERVDHYETVRQRKDGSLVEVSLTISPISTSDGTIVGASKIARDISERKIAHERQQFLISARAVRSGGEIRGRIIRQQLAVYLTGHHEHTVAAVQKQAMPK